MRAIGAIVVLACALPALGQATVIELGMSGFDSVRPVLVSADGARYFAYASAGATDVVSRFDPQQGWLVVPALPGGGSPSLVQAAPDCSAVIGQYGSSGFVWREQDGTVDLGLIPGRTSNAPKSLSADGSRVVGTFNGGPWYIWDRGSGLRGFPDGPSGFIMQSGVVVEDGIVFGFPAAAGHSPYRVFRLAGNTWDPLPQVSRAGLGIMAGTVSLNGTVVGRGQTENGRLPLARWSPGSAPVVITDASPYRTATVLNADASVIVQNGTNVAPVLATSAGFELLPPPPGATEWTALTVSDDGVVVHGRRLASGQTVAIVWTREGGTRVLTDALTAAGADLTPWTGVEFFAMSRDGRTFLGIGTRAGVVQGLVARLPRP